MIRLRRATLALLATFSSLLGPSLVADPLSRKFEVDFFRDVPSRNLKGLAARSDGRLLSGPVLTKLAGTLDADLLWTLEPGTEGKWYVGTGPSGKILEVTLDRAANTFTASTLAALDETQILSLRRLPDGRLLAGASPSGRLYLINGDGTVATQLTLPVDSIFDLVLVDDKTALVATGNPGRIYRVELGAFAAAGLNPEKLTAEADLTARGVTLFGEIRDRNVRRLALAGDRLIAGSAPRGNIYAFPRAGGGDGPVILHENRDAEVTDLLALPDGSFYAALVFAGTSTEGRLATRPPAPAAGERAPALPEPGVVDRFPGRSTLMYFPAGGFPETVAARANTALYRIGQRGNLLVLAGGEQGELLGYAIAERRSLNFAGSDAAQVNGLAPLDPTGDAFLVLGNNAPQLAVLDFRAVGKRSAETRRIDLGTPTRFGQVRFARLRDVTPAQLSLALRSSQGTDDLEGWTPWTTATATDDAWLSPGLQGRYARLKLELADGVAEGLMLDKASLYHLPQNRRPQLQDFRLLPAGYALVPRNDSISPVTLTLGQMVSALRGEGSPGGDDRRSAAILGSLLTRQPGAQIAYWNVGDPDGDTLAATFSLRREGDDTWTDLAVQTREAYAQFDITHLSDGLYFTRLVVAEQAPRPEADRLTVTYETDDLVIDRTAPEILEATVTRNDRGLVLTVRGRDALSLLAGIEATFNHGVKETLEQPADGILDGRTETFVLELPALRVQGATSVEVLLYDSVGNSSARRLGIP